jgi:hypothetical protein
MDTYCLEVRKLENRFYGLEFHHVVRNNNVTADVLSKLGSTRAQVPAGIFVHELHALSGIHPGYSCKEGGKVEDGLLLEFPCTPTRSRSV